VGQNLKPGMSERKGPVAEAQTIRNAVTPLPRPNTEVAPAANQSPESSCRNNEDSSECSKVIDCHSIASSEDK